MAADVERLASGELLRERAARRDGRRFAGFLRRLLRHDRRSSLLLAGRRRQLDDDRARFAGGIISRSADAEVTKRSKRRGVRLRLGVLVGEMRVAEAYWFDHEK